MVNQFNLAVFFQGFGDTFTNVTATDDHDALIWCVEATKLAHDGSNIIGGGNEENFIARPSSSGLISSGAALMPQAWADIVNSSLNRFDSQGLYPDHLAKIWNSGLAVSSLSRLYRANPAACIKMALEIMGLIPRSLVTPSTQDISPVQVKQLETQLKELNLF